jgi:type IV secretory pathway VirB3-like protein
MKKFEVYKHIRRQAMIAGLPITLFALMMLSIIGSLLVIIFSFSFYGVLGAMLLNAVLYVVLLQFTRNSSLLHFKKVFPNRISTKQTNILDYEEN